MEQFLNVLTQFSNEQFLLWTNSVTGMFVVVLFLHWMSGKNAYIYLGAVIATALISTQGAQRIFYMGDYPLLGGSLYTPMLVVLITMLSYELKTRVSRVIMLATMVAIVIMSLGNMRWLIFEAISPNATTFDYGKRVDHMTMLFVAAITVYFTINARIITLHLQKMSGHLGNFFFLVAMTTALTYMQIKAHHAEFFIANEDLLSNTLAFRMSVLVFFSVTYWIRFRSKIPGDPEKSRIEPAS